MESEETILALHIVSQPEVRRGRPYVQHKGRTVEQIAICHELVGMSPSEIAAQYDLAVAEVHRALAYYHEHKAEFDTSIREGEMLYEQLKRATPSFIAEKLRAHGV